MVVNSVRRWSAVAACLLVGCLSVVPQAARQGQGPGGRLEGDVADLAENAPIRYAFVLVHSGLRKEDIRVKVDENGRYDLQLPPGLYDVFVAAEGFAPFCKKVGVFVGRTTTVRARLKPDAEHLETSSQ
jgi:hypothetical protein